MLIDNDSIAASGGILIFHMFDFFKMYSLNGPERFPETSAPEIINVFSCSPQLSVELIMLINV